MTELVFTCIAAGTFLYISCSEVIIEEFSIPQYRCSKLIAYLLGIAIISALKLFENMGDEIFGNV